MASTPRYPEEYLEPKKYDPGRPVKKQKEVHEPFLSEMEYENIATTNPFTFQQALPTFREEMKERECYFPPALFHGQKPGEAKTNHDGLMTTDEFHWQAMTPSFRNRMLEQSQKKSDATQDPAYLHFPSPESYYRGLPSPEYVHKCLKADQKGLGVDLLYSPHKTQFVGISKSFSDNHFYDQNPPDPQQSQWSHPRANIPTPLILHSTTPSNTSLNRSRSPAKRSLSAIDEQAEIEKHYKVEVREHPQSEVKVLRSPMKRFFGEHGILGHSASNKEPSPRFRKNSFALLSNRFKERIEELSRDFSMKMPSNNDGNQNATRRASKFPVSLPPYAQADMYMRLELLLTIECNRFLMNAFTNNQVSLASMKRVMDAWARKGRPQVLAFRYDLGTQRDLVVLNIDSLPFKGPNSSSRVRVEAVLAAWGVLAREMSIRTFCQPDSAVKKHLHDAERVFMLLGVAQDTLSAVQDLKRKIFTEIHNEQKAEQEGHGAQETE